MASGTPTSGHGLKSRDPLALSATSTTRPLQLEGNWIEGITGSLALGSLTGSWNVDLPR